MPATPTTTEPRLTRALAFERVMHAAVGRVVTTAWGQAFLEPPLARCYERNQAWAVEDAAGLEAPALDRDVDRLFADAGLGHRMIAVEPPAAARLAGGMGALGYAPSRHLYLVFEGRPPPAPRAAVHEVGIEAVVAGNDRYLRADPDTAFGRDDAVRADILEHHRTYGSAGADERCFAVLDEAGEAAAWAKLWTRDGVAQVEDVVCLHEHRGRGYGRDVVAAATRAGLAGDPELVFIVADDEDWPKTLYVRVGYAPVGTKSVWIRHAPGHRWGARVAPA